MPDAGGWPMVHGDARAPAGSNGARPRRRSGCQSSAPDPPRHAADVLADRIAATLVSHEPGWRLPRPSELARRNNVSVGEVYAAVDQLVARQIVRRSPNGQLYRSSPAEYMIRLEGTARLGTRVDPMSGNLTCLSYNVSWRPAPEDAACALQIAPGDPVCALQLTWAMNDAPAAVSTTYLAGHLAHPGTLAEWLATAADRGVLPLVPPRSQHADSRCRRPDCLPQAAAIQMELPPTSIARRLRLSAGQMAILVTVSFAQGAQQRPAALSVAVLRPDMFRIVMETEPSGPVAENLTATWRLAVGDDRA
jgi:DNA-binding GntR family transcriptional regulator